MKLEDIGFYTLSDKRIENISPTSPMMRGEIILLDSCNFKCPYCKGIKPEYRGVMPLARVIEILDIWTKDGLQNIRFSGGEPTLYPSLKEIVTYAKNHKVKRIALSTNGSADLNYYKRLIELGVNDFSISLDSCCSSTGKKMSGNIEGAWEKVVSNIEALSKITYVTVGVVITNDNYKEVNDIVKFADGLGVADIRVITAAQKENSLHVGERIDEVILSKYPILNYRIENIKKGRSVRGMSEISDYRKCPLVLDDSAMLGNNHFPCIIYLREGGKPIGTINPNMRQERVEWFEKHNSLEDSICCKNCLDVCVDFANKFRELRVEYDIEKIDSSLFDYETWSKEAPSQIFDIPWRGNFIEEHKEKIKKYAVGYCFSEDTAIRVKEDHVCVMFFKDDKHFWTHLRHGEFDTVFGRIKK